MKVNIFLFGTYSHTVHRKKTLTKRLFRYINSMRKVRVTKHILRKGLYSDQTLTGDRVNNKY